MGTAMAIVGAFVLAAETAATPDDPAGAQQRHQDKISPLLDTAEQIPGGGMAMKIFFGHTEEFVLATY
ncbi:hypothetical protein [Nocardia sp. NPDC058633]|uniref:hypothetical protein n=1 Tax=Nocardia sp. NPDC058633 TaxID=3346568 RepID=UPI0036493E7C